VRRRDGPFVVVTWGTVELVIGVKRVNQEETITWGRTESLSPRGTALILGWSEPRLGWEVDGRLLAVRYGQGGSIRDGGVLQRGEHLITASLWERGPNWFAQGNLTQNAQEKADIILSTLTLA